MRISTLLLKITLSFLVLLQFTAKLDAYSQQLVIDSLWGNNGLVSMDANNDNNGRYFIYSQIEEFQIVKHFGTYITDEEFQRWELRHFSADYCLDSTSSILNQFESENGGLFMKHKDLYAGYIGIGETTEELFYAPTIKKELSNGLFDNDFEDNFRSNFNPDFYGHISSICASNSDNTFLAAGHTAMQGSSFIAKFNYDGTIDSTYAINGYFPIISLDYNLYFYPQTISLLSLENGACILTGLCFDPNSNLQLYFAASLDANGQINNAFASNGLFLRGADLEYSQVQKTVQFSDGFITLIPSLQDDFILMKLSNNGQIDSTFGNNGIISLPQIPLMNTLYTFLYRHSENSFFLISSPNNFQANGKIMLFSSDGELSTSFGQDGEFELNIPGYQTKIHSIVPISETEYISVIETTSEVNSMNNLYTVKLVSSSQASPSLIQENTTLTASAPNAISYQWYINGVEISDAIDSSFTYSNNGVYSVKFTDIHGCEYSIGSVTITDVGIENISKAEFNIFPNPNSGQFSISHENPNEKFTIYNAVGKSVITNISNGALVNLDTSGVYFILSSTGKSQKIIVH